MARNFPGAGANRLNRTVPFTSMADITVAFWIKLDTTQASGNRAFVYGSGGSRGIGLGFQTGPTTLMQVVVQGVAWGGAGFTLGTGLRHVGYTRAGSGNLHFYVDGVDRENFAVSPGTPLGTDLMTLMGSDEGSLSCDGSAGELAVWQAGLSAAEMMALFLGAPPSLVRGGTLKAHVPVWGIATPEPDVAAGANWSLTGTGTAVDHFMPVAQPIGAYS